LEHTKRRRFVIGVLLAFAAAAAAEDGAAVKALLKKYAPDGFYVVDAYSKVSAEYGRKDFMAYWDASTEDARWRSYNAIVRESALGAMALLRNDDNTLYILSRERSYQVPWTSVWYSRIVAREIPERLRFSNYGLVNDFSENDITQVQAGGVYALLEEMAAFHLAATSAWDLLPYVQSLGSKAPWGSYLQSINESISGILEFKYYTLKYLLYVERDDPSIYRGVIANKVFGKAFTELDAACTALVKRYFAGKEELYASIRASGQTAREEGAFLLIGPKGKEARKELHNASYSALAAELAKPAYRDLTAKLNGGAVVEPTPPFPGTTLAVSGAAPAVKPVISDEEALQLGGLNIGYGKRSAVIATQQLRAAREAVGKAAAAGSGSGAAGDARETPAPDYEEEPPEDGAAVAVAAAIEDLRAGRPSGGARLTRREKGEAGNVPMKAIDIVGADLRVFPDMLVCGISFAAFNGKIPLNGTKLAANTMEYDCSLVIDLDGDGKKVYALGLSWFKAPNSKPLDAPVAETCPAGLWKYEGSGASKVQAEVSASIAGSLLVFVIEDSPAFPLKKLTERTSYTVTTYYDQGAGPMEDSIGL